MNTMDKKRVLRESRALTDICQSVSYDLNEGHVALEMIPFPRGWAPRTGAIVYDLPDTYPQEQPDAYLPQQMRYNGSKPLIMLRSGPDGWAKHCIHDFSDKWVPERHTMVTMTRMIKKSLEHPNERDPWQNY